MRRKVDLENIIVPEGYQLEIVRRYLTTPIDLTIVDGEMFVGDAGVTDGDGKLIKITSDGSDVIANGFNPPLTGITYHKGYFYVSHRGKITKVSETGKKKDIVENLPSFGDHHNNRVIFGPDGKMYFGQGTATNSGVVGLDNIHWVNKHPYFHDYPGYNSVLQGLNFETTYQNKHATTGAFSPYDVASYPNEIVKGIKKASGSVLRANEDGSELELIAWGLRNPFRLRFHPDGRLFCTNHGMDIRGSRPIANSPDEFRTIEYGRWYGWPDYTGGYPVTHPHFKPDDKPQPLFLLAQHPMVPSMPFVNFLPHSAITGFDFGNNQFGYTNDAFIAEFGAMDPETTGGKTYPSVGRKISRIDMQTKMIVPFIYNQQTEGEVYGLERPIDVLINQDTMFIVDFGIHEHSSRNGSFFIPGSGVIFKLTKNK